VQTWMYHGDLIGGLAAKLAGRIPVAWNIRHSTLDTKEGKRSTYWTVQACAWLSHWLPTRIVCCSESSRQIHAALGYAANDMVVIPNGFDLAAFKPDQAARLSVRGELGIPAETPLIGLVANFRAQKDHATFVQAAARLHADLPEVHFLLCGQNITSDNSQLDKWVTAAGIRDHCHLLGRREDIPRLTAALDVATTASAYGEGFPNVIGEAMACGIPCVVTDVGDSASIVGDTGRVVPPRDPLALAQAWRAVLSLRSEGRAQVGEAARRRIEEQFSLPVIAARYQCLYDELALST
ncbi:MAG: glycosyltransferase, partial [Candidatus Binatia bacterium]